ncbi:hypothetical protein H2204_010362 [Knufia peltigerae]|uniref:Uncharacterized protein n=1 Tax=Knufia peltigerae TaxID=1002370 RepID=A0AA38XW89_9EURO|nr:hypothetical protein H2204_010362 [Knufia peltigerae]
MPPNIPASLAIYIQACLEYRASTLITSILNTPSTWLVLRMVYAALYGAAEDSAALGQYTAPGGNTTTTTTTTNNNNETRPVIFVSLLRSLSLWVEMGRKVGLDIPLLLKRKSIIYIDGMSLDGGVAPSSSGTSEVSTLPTLKLKSLSLRDIQEAVTTGLRTLSSTSTPTNTSAATTLPRSTTSSALTPRIPLPPSSSSTSRTSAPTATSTTPLPTTMSTSGPLIFIDGVDFILASQPSVTPSTLDSFLGALRTQGAHALVVTGQADAPLLHSAVSGDGDVAVGGATPLERAHAHFMTTQAHQSRWVWQLRGLDTGSAKDVTGVMRVSRGGSMDFDEEDAAGSLTDIERLYQLKGDGSVRIWSRGE